MNDVPTAWMGYATRVAHSKRPCVRVCAYCPDKKAADALAESKGYDVTHSICPSCYQIQIAQITGS